MNSRFLFFLILGSLVLGQVGFAQTYTAEDTYGQNRVQIVINQDGHKPKAPKKIAKKLPAKKMVAVKKSAVKGTTPVVAAAPIIIKPSHIPLGKRVTLANQGYAHANGYNGTEENQIMPNTTSYPAAPNLVAKIKKREEEKEPSSWEVKLRSYNAVDMNALENYGATRDYTIRAWERLNITYNFNHDVSLSLMPQYYHTWFQDQNRPQSLSNPGLNQSYASNLGDTALYLTDNNIASFGGTVSTSKTGAKKVDSPFILGGSQSYFAPTSEPSETAGELGETRTNLNLSKSFGKLDLRWTEEFRYYLQQYNTNAFIATNGKPIANTAYRVLNLLDVGYNFTSKLNFTVETGVVNEYDYGDTSTNLDPQFIDYLVMNPDLGYTFNDHFGLDLGIWEIYNYTTPPTIEGGQTASYTPFAPYNGTAAGTWSGTEVYLQGTIKF